MKRTTAMISCLGLAAATSAALADHTVQIVNDRPGVFMDISGTGTALGLSDDGETNIVTAIGNVLLPAGDVRIGNNGGAAWGITTGDLFAGNANIAPTETGIAFGGGNAALLAFWDDLDSEQGDVYWQEMPGMLVIQWDQRPHFPGTTAADTVTFQIKVFDGADGMTTPYAQFIYTDTTFSNTDWDDGASATIGYQSPNTRDNNVQWSFNTAGAVSAGTVLSVVVPSPGSLALLGMGGLVAIRRRR